MRERVELLVGRATRAMWVMTFHAACARMLRSHADKLGYTRQFTIYDAADQRRLIKKCLDDLGFDPKRFTPRAMQSQISDAKNRLRSPDDYAELVGSNFEQTVADVYQLYDRELHRMNAMDFDDLLVRSVQLLERFQEVHDHYAATFRWVMVDEYQDTNRVQYRWLQLLTSEHRNLAVVGDDAQSIYGFRGADIRNILEFQDDYPDAHVVKLEQNYRSTQTILDAANAVISHNRGQMVKHLWTDVGEGDKVRVREMADEFAEARWVTAEIQRLVDEGVSRSEIAVFYRTNAQSRVLEDMLVRAGVAYQVIGGPKFYERAEIKDAIQYLTFLVNPQDATAFTRIANSPRRGIGQTSLSRVLAYAAAEGISVWEAAEGEIPGLATAARKSLDALHGHDARRCASGWRAARRSRSCSTSCWTRPATATRCGPSGRSRPRAGSRTSTSWSPRRRQFDMNAPDDGGSLGEFLQQTSLVADADTIRDDEGLVTLMTMHNAKGLEFPIVFMIGMEEGDLPALALDRGQPDRGGAAARVRRPDARDARPHAHLRAPPPVLRRRRGRTACARASSTSCRRELTDQAARIARGFPAPGRIASWSAAAAASAEAERQDAQIFHVGDDIVHAHARRGRGHRRPAGRDRRRALRGRVARPQADGRRRADPQALRIRTPRGRASRLVGAGGGDLASPASDAQAAPPRLDHRPGRHVVLRGDHAAAARPRRRVRPVEDRRRRARRGVPDRHVHGRPARAAGWRRASACARRCCSASR